MSELIDKSVSLTTMLYLGALIFVFGILFAFAWKKKSDQKTDDEGSEIAKGDSAAVPDAATATNFQLLSVFPNVIFGMGGFILIPLLNVVGFLVGNYFTSKQMRRLMEAIKAHETPHSYIAIVHGLPKLRRVTAWISFLVFTGVTCFEIVYLARISEVLLGGSNASYYVLVAMLTIAMITVAIAGHQRAALAADRWLLLIAYVGLHLAAGYLLTFVEPVALDFTTILVMAALLFMIYFRFRRCVEAGAARWRHGIVMLSSAILFGTLLRYKVLLPTWSATAMHEALNALTLSGNGLSPWVFFLATIASLCPVLFYNFVDFSFWQKYSSEVRPGESPDALVLRIKKPFWIYVWESPLSWLLPLLMGIYAAGRVTVEPDGNPVSAIVKFFEPNGFRGVGVAVLLFASLVAIAASTACGYLVSTSQLFYADLRMRGSTSNRSPIPLVLMGCGMIFFLVIVDMIFPLADQLIALMLTCFAPLCALTPLVVRPLFKGPICLSEKGKSLIIPSLIFASVSGAILGVLSAFLKATPTDAIFWASLPTSFVLAWMFYGLIVRFGVNKNPEQSKS